MTQHICNQCGWVFSRKTNLTQNLKSRKKLCRSSNASDDVGGESPLDEAKVNEASSMLAEQRRRNIPTFSDSTSSGGIPIDLPVKKAKNPKIQALLSEIINDGIPTAMQPINDEPILKIKDEEVPPFLVMELDQPKPASLTNTEDDDEEEEDTESDSEADDDYIDISDLPPPDNVKFLPETIEGLAKRFNKLFCEFWREKQYKHRNELVFLLNEMLRQCGITRDIYKQVNSLLAQSLTPSVDVKEPEELAGEKHLKKMVQSTADYLKEHDEYELLELIEGIGKEERDH